jgi:Ctr copper transporter family
LYAQIPLRCRTNAEIEQIACRSGRAFSVPYQPPVPEDGSVRFEPYHGDMNIAKFVPFWYNIRSIFPVFNSLNTLNSIIQDLLSQVCKEEKNTQKTNMDHSHHDHSSHAMMDHSGHGGGMGHGSDQCNMNMLFTFSTENLCIVFRQWRITSPLSLLVSLIAIVALGAGYEALREGIRRYESAVAKRVETSPRKFYFCTRSPFFVLLMPGKWSYWDEWIARCAIYRPE